MREWHIPNALLLFQVFSPVDMQVQSPTGLKTGKDFENNKTINQISGAFYTGFNTDIEFLTIPNPENGEYKILVQGTGEGEYKIEMTKIKENENDPQEATESTVTLTGTAEEGKIEEKTIEVIENEVIFNPDTTPPTITGYATTQLNVNGWYTSDVTIHFEATDDESGIESVTPDITISTEGANQSVTGTATDKAGNSATFTVTGINIDKNPPTITISSLEEKEYLNNQILPISYEVTDNISPQDKININAIYDGENFSGDNVDLSLENLGEHIFKVVAADEAGNTSEKIINFQNTTSLDAIQNNVEHYWNLGLIKKKYEKTYLEFKLEQLEELFKWLNQFENSNLNPVIKKLITDGIKKIINSYIGQLIFHINHVAPQLIDQKAADLLIESLNFIRP